MRRAQDWLRQAELDLAAATDLEAAGHFEWTCFLAQQAVEAAKGLDKHYIGARYPNSHPQGAPGDLYTPREASQALADAQTVLEHVRSRLSQA